MSIADKFKKIQRLFVETDESAPRRKPVSETAPASEPVASPSAEDDAIDQKLAALNRNTAQVLNTGKGETGMPSPETPTEAPVAETPVTTAATVMPRTIEELVRESEGPNLGDIQVPVATTPVALAENGTVDFGVIYGQAALPASPFTAEQTIELVQSLPADLPLAAKKMTLQATVTTMGKAIGATPETIVADASRKVAALAAYAESFATHTAEFVAAAEFEIAALEKQITEKRQAIADARAQQERVTSVCEAEVDRLDDVLSYFSSTVS